MDFINLVYGHKGGCGMTEKVCRKMLPLGVDRFEELRSSDYYYIDKTKFIEELLSEQFEVNLITRPRRFGKTLGMSMLADFFDMRKDSSASFEGLEITKNKPLCETWMNQWPVLFVSLKDIEDLDFDGAYAQLADTISDLCIEHAYLLESDRVDPADKKRFLGLKSIDAPAVTVRNSLFILTRMMHAHYGKKVILLIDEYDVPLAKANEHGYYEKMLNCIRGMLSKALKTNPFLKFAVVTGCLRIVKESIFTGTNHFVANSISGDRYTDIFGFTEREVARLLADYDLTEYAADARYWYDGYRFGPSEIYCPWDILNYVSALRLNPQAKPGSYWKDTSHNDIIRSFIGQTQYAVNDKFENLMAGGYIQVKVCDDLTYDLLHSSEENFWSILYLTGYLTMVAPELVNQEELSAGETCLRIPNEEVRTIFSETVVQWIRDSMMASDRGPLLDALWSGDAERVTAIISDLLFQMISYHNYREDFYHAFLTGLFVGIGYPTESDKEHGEGRPDIIVKDKLKRRVIIIEAKHSKNNEDMDRDCERAVSQIALQKYAQGFLEGYQTRICYGVAFYKKQCLVKRIDIL